MTDTTLSPNGHAPTTNDLIPAEHQERLLQARGAGDAEFWTVGDVSAELVDDADGAAKRDAIRSAIGALAGLAANTVRDYEACARFYPQSARDSYPSLTRYHFRHAKRAKTLPAAEEWLALARDSADDYGGLPMPVDVLAARMNGKKGRAEPDFAALLRLALAALGRARDACEDSAQHAELNRMIERLEKML